MKTDCEIITPDKAITLPQAAGYFTANGKKPAPASLWRWATKGIKGVKLQTRRYGRRMVTSPGA